MAHAARRLYSFDEYLGVEDMSPQIKHEFVDGQILAIAGGTPDHSAIAVNVQALLREQLAGKRCRVFNSDLRIRVKATGLGTYPDAAVVCGSLELDPDDRKGHSHEPHGARRGAQPLHGGVRRRREARELRGHPEPAGDRVRGS